MDMVLTVGVVLRFTAGVAGFALVLMSMLAMFASGMSPIPDKVMARKGCLTFMLGAVIVGGVIWQALS